MEREDIQDVNQDFEPSDRRASDLRPQTVELKATQEVAEPATANCSLLIAHGSWLICSLLTPAAGGGRRRCGGHLRRPVNGGPRSAQVSFRAENHLVASFELIADGLLLLEHGARRVVPDHPRNIDR